MSEAEPTQESGSQEAAAPAVNFIDTLPEDIRAEPSLKNFSDIGGLAKSYVHAQRLIGSDKVPIPGKSATEEDWDMVYSRLGRPTDVNGYEIEMPKAFEEKDSQRFREAAFKAGLNGSKQRLWLKCLTVNSQRLPKPIRQMRKTCAMIPKWN